MVTLAVDCMGGDFAPGEIVKGVADAYKKLPDTTFLMVGFSDTLRKECEALSLKSDRISIVHADEVVGMEESPVEALKKKKRSSIVVAVKLVRTGKAQAVVSAGNTGAAVAANYMGLGCLKGTRRPGIAACFYLHSQPVVIMDVGANIHCKPQDLFAYAVMGSLYSREVLNVKEPRIGLLNIGQEEKKGNPLVRKASHLLQQSDMNYVGNIEGDKIFSNKADVIVCEGFVGNIVLKVAEGLSENVIHAFIKQLAESPETEPSALVSVKDGFKQFKWHIDYAEQGGAPLLGLNGVCIICHGRSRSRAISNAVIYAYQMVKKDLNQKIEKRLANSNKSIKV